MDLVRRFPTDETTCALLCDRKSSLALTQFGDKRTATFFKNTDERLSLHEQRALLFVQIHSFFPSERITNLTSVAFASELRFCG